MTPQLAIELYGELRRIAARHFRYENPGNTLQPTAVANEAYMRLAQREPGGWGSQEDFLAAATEAIRRVLIDHARGKKRQKRGGGLVRVDLNGAETSDGSAWVDLVDFDDSLSALERQSPRAAKVAGLRIYGGLTLAEIAAALPMSLGTAKADWALAQAWLRRRLLDDSRD